MPKTYWIMKDVYTQTLPPEFTSSRGPRWIQVRQCKAIKNNALIGDIELHSDIVKRDYFADHFIMYGNEQVPYKPMKYAYNSTDRNVNVWFTLMDGTEVKPDHFTIVMLLCY